LRNSGGQVLVASQLIDLLNLLPTHFPLLLPGLAWPGLEQALQELCGFLEEQMGLASGWLLQVPCTLLLYVSSARRIQACVLAEAIKGAFPVHPSLAPSSAAAAQGMRSCGSAAAAVSSGEGAAHAEGTAAAAAAHAAGAFPAAAVVAQVATSGRSLLSVTLSSGAATAECGGSGSGSAAAPGGIAGGGPAAEEGRLPAPPATEWRQQQAPPPPQQQQPQQQEQQQHQYQLPLPPPPQQQGAGVALALDRRQRVRAVCGVRLMWVSVEARRRGLASRLLDCCRCQFMPGYVLPRHELAFR
jgi:N-acetyltransferase